MSKKVDSQAESAMRQPDTKAVTYEMTDERKAKFSRVCGLIVDLLRANASGPGEAYMILKFVVTAFEERYGIRGGVIVGDEEHS